MIIEGVLKVVGPDIKLYHPAYFKSVDQLLRTITTWKCYFYGNYSVNHTSTTVALDVSKFKSIITGEDFVRNDKSIQFDKDIQNSWIVSNPIIPPKDGWIDDNTQVDMWSLRIRFLHFLDECAPKYVSFDNSDHHIKVRFNPDSSSMFISHDTNKFSYPNSIFFVNGLCCKPSIATNDIGEVSVELKNGKTYLQNQKDRSRGVVIVDFSKLCNLRYIPLSVCDGDITNPILPNSVDPDTNSFLLVIDGRLFLPDEFGVLGRTVKSDGLITEISRSLVFNPDMYKKEYELDRLCCSNKFVSRYSASLSTVDGGTATTNVLTTRNLLATKNLDLKKSDNSFVIVFDRPGLHVIRHRCMSGEDESMFIKEPQSLEPMHRIIFGGDAAGLLMDTSTRSIIDYTLEENDQTLYVKGENIEYVLTKDTVPVVGKEYYTREKSDNKFVYTKVVFTSKNSKFESGKDYFVVQQLPFRWYTKLLMIKHSTPLEIWGNYNNVMSASASMHDNKTLRGSAMVLCPRYTMLDFIFEGD